ncbi:MAG: hypothetical protein AABZ06_01320 [Bdellovibrionota bacterium]
MGGANSGSDIPAKSVWRGQDGKQFSFFCPLCKSRRKVDVCFAPNPVNFKLFWQAALCGIVFSLITWSRFSWKGIVSILPFLAGAEFIYRIRRRRVLVCPSCGFDPYLYLVDAKLARKEIEDHTKRQLATRQDLNASTVKKQEAQAPASAGASNGNDKIQPE